MNATLISSFNTKRRQAMALVMVITVVALMSMLIVAIFSVTRTEYKATQAYVAGKSAKQLSDIGTAIVQAQIQNGQNTSTSSTARTTHATQPGMVRVYAANGNFSAAYKLYSSSQMKVTGTESSLYSDQHVPPSNWSTLTARYVDLNDPVVRPGLTSGQNAVYFPVMDPRAAWNYGSGGQSAGASGKRGTTQIEGFSYTKTAPTIGSGGGQDYSSNVVTPTDATTPDSLRVPMPVEWLYVLEDGTVGALDSSNKFVSSGTSTATATNPIVGRIAFWTDDESCKININTAGEPTYLGAPFYYHERDSKWAHFPPVTGEYQRYPGHPATVALSAVLAPNYLLDPLLPSLDGLSSYSDVVNLKEQIYDLVPKLKSGGSKAGTRPFAADQVGDQTFYVGGGSTYAQAIDLSSAVKERLYASVDEMLFKDLDYTTGTGRTKASVLLPNGTDFYSHDALERARFFLTAQSRSPEFNIHGLPRVSMWPVADESLGAKYRTTFDNMIALCATIKKDASSSPSTTRSYFFRRANSRSGSSDLNISRNQSLLSYLTDQMSQHTWPSTSYASSSSQANFSDKYGMQNVNQLAVQFFDYVRCTNLYDGIMARGNDGWNSRGQNQYNFRDNDTCYTFTSARVTPKPGSVDVSGDLSSGNMNTATTASAQQGMLPGHGQVSPAVWSKGGSSYKGFGRMITISEIGFQFICTADGTTDNAVLSTLFPLAGVNGHPEGWGGGSALRFQTDATDTFQNPVKTSMTSVYTYMSSTADALWWSNFPPFQSVNPSKAEVDYAMLVYGCQVGTGRSVNAAYHPSKHPGFDPANWNYTLPVITPPTNDGKWKSPWLLPNQRRVQVLLLLETFCPSLGHTGFYPEWTMVLDGTTVAQMKITDADGVVQPLFNTAGDVPIKSNGNLYGSDFSHPVGGHAGPSALTGGRAVRGIANSRGVVQMQPDNAYFTGNTSGHNGTQNYAFTSDFVTVNSNSAMKVTFPSGDIKIKIYDTHNWESAKEVQTVRVNFGQLPSSLPAPTLAGSARWSQTTDSLGRLTYTRAMQAPHYWTANFDGCVGKRQGRVNPAYDGVSSGKTNFYNAGAGLPPVIDSKDSTGLRNFQGIQGRLSNGSAAPGYTTNESVTYISNRISIINPSDTVVSIVPALGDYRTLAARYDVPSSWWKPHPLSGSGTNLAHSFTGFYSNGEPGCKLAQANGTGAYVFNPALQLVGGARHDLNSLGNQTSGLSSHQPDLPPGADSAAAANAFGDFDTGIGNAREGPYINKPDEGNFYVGPETRTGTKVWRSAYFAYTWQQADDWRSGISMTPNRLVSSPVMFGSLPTGVFGNPNGLPSAPGTVASGGGAIAPWQTLLFRPHTQNVLANPNSQSSHPGMQDPCDHYLLDLFFMPVVEPYAISEPLSIAGRVNMNYQIMPFTNIRRATGMHAVMKGEYVTAIPSNAINAAKEYVPNQAVWSDRFRDDKNDKYYWHRPVDVAATLRQFDLKFQHQSGGQDAYQGLFRSASQICEMHLIPTSTSKLGGGASGGVSDASGVATASSQSQINSIMNTFWSNNRATGDNVRERPYSNLYARLTTRSNTFRVHVRAQVLKKARSTSVDTFDPVKDAVISEYRGSSLIERYIDPNDLTASVVTANGSVSTETMKDYPVDGINQTPLDAFYRFRTLETKRFNP